MTRQHNCRSCGRTACACHMKAPVKSTCSCNMPSCTSCYTNRFKADYGAHQSMASQTQSYQQPHSHCHSPPQTDVCIEFVCDTEIRNPTTKMPMMIKASLVNPVKQWMPMDDARYWIECGMARYCGDNKHEDVHSNRGMPGRPGAPGRPGPRGEMGPPGESPYLQLERTTDGVRLIAINPHCEDPEVQEITLATPATIFKTMCDCWNQVFV